MTATETGAELGELGLRSAGDKLHTTRLQVGMLELDRIDRAARWGSRDIALLPREYLLLEYLMRHAGQVVTRATLLEHVWKSRPDVRTNVVDVYIGKLRRKIANPWESPAIRTLRGTGFMLLL